VNALLPHKKIGFCGVSETALGAQEVTAGLTIFYLIHSRGFTFHLHALRLLILLQNIRLNIKRIL
jgi:hypothetical protein